MTIKLVDKSSELHRRLASKCIAECERRLGNAAVDSIELAHARAEFGCGNYWQAYKEASLVRSRLAAGLKP